MSRINPSPAQRKYDEGRLAQVLERLADHLEQVQRQQHKARTALIYPCVLMGVSLAVVVGLMSFVVPRLTEQFAHSGQSLPLITRLLIGASEALLLAGPWLLGAAVLGAAACHPAWHGDEKSRDTRHPAFLKI